MLLAPHPKSISLFSQPGVLRQRPPHGCKCSDTLSIKLFLHALIMVLGRVVGLVVVLGEEVCVRAYQLHLDAVPPDC